MEGPMDSSTIVALAGLGVALGTTTLTVVASYKTAKGSWSHASSLAAEDRRQQRKADAYLEVLEVAEHLGHWAQTIRPSLSAGQPDPDLPALERQRRANALLGAFGSATVQSAHDDWWASVHEVRLAVRHIDIADLPNMNTPRIFEKKMDAWERLESQLRGDEERLRKRLHDLVGAELGHRPLDSWRTVWRRPSQPEVVGDDKT
jgi:hypothetical protein